MHFSDMLAPAARMGARAALVLLLACQGAAAAAPGWPSVKLPPGASPFSLGDQMSVNGLPVRSEGFVIRKAPLETAQWFRDSMGQPLMEDRVGDKLVLGRAEGTYYVTVQLEAAGADGKSTRGTILLADLKGAHDRRDDTQAVNARLLARLPSGTRLINQMSSTDQGKLASYVLAENGNSEASNRSRVIETLRAEGYTLDRETKLDGTSAPSAPLELLQGRTLYFKGAGKDAMVMIRPAGEGKTSIVINTVTTMERLK